MNKEENNRSNQNPDDTEKAKMDVESSKDKHVTEDFPGYPHYPSKEDIMDQRTDSHRVDVDVENFAAGQNASGINERYARNNDQQGVQSNEANDQQPAGNKDK